MKMVNSRVFLYGALITLVGATAWGLEREARHTKEFIDNEPSSNTLYRQLRDQCREARYQAIHGWAVNYIGDEGLDIVDGVGQRVLVIRQPASNVDAELDIWETRQLYYYNDLRPEALPTKIVREETYNLSDMVLSERWQIDFVLHQLSEDAVRTRILGPTDYAFDYESGDVVNVSAEKWCTASDDGTKRFSASMVATVAGLQMTATPDSLFSISVAYMPARSQVD